MEVEEREEVRQAEKLPKQKGRGGGANDKG